MAKPRGRRLHKNKEEVEEDITERADLNVLQQQNYDDAEIADPQQPSSNGKDPNTFFGVLDSEELDYFKRSEATLSINTFETEDDKKIFIQNVIQEANKKELKLATSQICSKLMERLVLDCEDTNLTKQIFKNTQGFFYNLSCQKYSSHVVETLLIKSAEIVEKELLAHYDGPDSMESLMIEMIHEFEDHLEHLLTHQYGSHVLRVLLLIFASKFIPNTAEVNSQLRSKKSKIARKMIQIKDTETFNKSYQTPGSFKLELKKLLSKFYNDLQLEDEDSKATEKLRDLCLNKIASPVLQLIIQVEGIFDKDRKFYGLIYNPSKELDSNDTKEASFIKYCINDSVGCHFLENCLINIKPVYRNRLFKLYLESSIEELYKRAIFEKSHQNGIFILKALIEHCNLNDARKIVTILIPLIQVPQIYENEFSMDLVAKLLEFSAKNDNYMREKIMKTLIGDYKKDSENNDSFMEDVLKLNGSTLGNRKDDWPTSEERRRALFMETLIKYDPKFLNILIDNLLFAGEIKLIDMCLHGCFSFVVENALDVKQVEIIKRRQLLNIFSKHAVELACNAFGSHIMDKLWFFSSKIMINKERIAQSLLNEEEKVKNSNYGKMVWKNWTLELYKRKLMDWKRKCKDLDAELFPDSKPIQQKSQLKSGNNSGPNNNGPRTTYNSFTPRREKRKYQNDQPKYDENYKRSR
ncbi:ARM repeat-containing protein [Hanseniaspora valbyensis NRRL Y-1626]|uniref:Nucleolar protein 9 n=1 Tax=Hanseniaspora valbyensis NRRL Y-1626 TaxID=766949 RepID=A0A1B7TE44_9ASCO|nr:ARM repeat-containing protein [Hanseniaspora valbyensis NRRL Y-1626]